jgi:peptidoglycan/xylan/chitin deacetylase (PgdA/CDA1 family)
MASIIAGKFLSPLARPIYSGIGHILMFHRIAQSQPDFRVSGAANIEYPPEQFSILMDELQSAVYRFVSMNTLAEILSSGEKTKKFIAVTFDDGYADNYTSAYPILKDRGIPFTIYVTTSFPDQKAVVWWYILEDMLNEDRLVDFDFRGTRYRFDSTNLEEKRSFGSTARNLLKTAIPEDFQVLVHQIIERQGIDPLQKVKQLSLNWEQIRQLAADPLVTIGAHTVNHLLLKELSAEIARNEIFLGRARLEEKLKRKVEHFAFPFGGANAAGRREFEIVREAGFKTGVTTRLANIFPGHKVHLECLPRIDMGLFPDYASLKTALDGWVPARLNHLQRMVTE